MQGPVSPDRTDDQNLRALRAEFKGWRFILSDRHRWWAMRGPLPPDRLNEVDAIDKDSAAELRAALVEESERQGFW